MEKSLFSVLPDELNGLLLDALPFEKVVYLLEIDPNLKKVADKIVYWKLRANKDFESKILDLRSEEFDGIKAEDLDNDFNFRYGKYHDLTKQSEKIYKKDISRYTI